MQPFWCNVAVLAVASLYLVWRAHAQVLLRRRCLLSRRVAWMLWVMAAGEEAWGELAEVD
jgi:hypothetical protein